MASASSSVGASPTGSGVPETPLSVKSAGASPPQSSGKHLHINLGNQFRAGGSLPNVNNNANCGDGAKEHSSPHTGAIHSIDLKVPFYKENSGTKPHHPSPPPPPWLLASLLLCCRSCLPLSSPRCHLFVYLFLFFSQRTPPAFGHVSDPRFHAGKREKKK